MDSLQAISSAGLVNRISRAWLNSMLNLLPGRGDCLRRRTDRARPRIHGTGWRRRGGRGEAGVKARGEGAGGEVEVSIGGHCAGKKNEHSTLVNVCTTYVFSLSIGTSLKIVVRLVRFCAIPSNQSPMSAMN